MIGGEKMACKLLSEYEQKLRIYLQHKHQYTNNSEQKRKRKVMRFLLFCCKRNVKAIKDIKKGDYDKFIQLELQGLKEETICKYKLALREFFVRAKLNINVKTQKQNKSFKKFRKFSINLCCNDRISAGKRFC